MTDRRKIGQELVRRVTRVSEVLEDNGRLRDEIARLRLTDAEREAIAYFAVIDGPQYLPAANAAATTLRGLLDRLK